MNTIKLSQRQLLLLSDACLILVATLWGSSYGVAKISLQFYPVLGFLAIRFGLTSLIVLPVLIRTYKVNKAVLKRTFVVGIPLGVILLAIFLFETYGLFYTTAANAAFLISLCIIMTPFMEWLLLKSRPHKVVFLCAIMSLLGTYLLTIASTEASTLSLNIGDMLILMAALGRALMVTMTKKLTDNKPNVAKTLSTIPSVAANNQSRDQLYNQTDVSKPEQSSVQISALALTAVQTLVVFVGSLALFIISRSLSQSTLYLPIQMEFWLPTLYLVIFCTLFAFFVQNWAVKIGSPSRAALLMGSEPLFGALFAVLLFNEQIGVLGWIGGALITLASILLVVRQK